MNQDVFMGMFQRILTEIVEMKKDIVEMKKDISELKTGLNNLRNEFYTYVKQNSTIQESQHVEFIHSVLRKYLPTIHIRRIRLKQFFSPSGKEITELDGCLLLDSTPPPLPLALTEGLRNNSLFVNPKAQYKEIVIIESKHSLNKVKLDTKLQQLFAIQEILTNPINIQSSAKAFQTMMRTYPELKQPSKVYIIFASDDIPHELKDFILRINEGITEESYIEMTLILLKNDLFFKKILDDSTIKQHIKQALKKAETFEELAEIAQLPEFQRYSAYLLSYIKPFSVVKDIYLNAKDKLGIAQYTVLEFPAKELESMHYRAANYSQFGGKRLTYSTSCI